MHKSRPGTVVIDCNADVAEAAEFWSEALGWPAEPLTHPDDANYGHHSRYCSYESNHRFADSAAQAWAVKDQDCPAARCLEGNRVPGVQ